MNRQPFERLLRTFDSDVPEVAPRDLLESVLLQLPSTNQRRRRFGVVRRFPDMLTPLRTVAVAAAVLVIALAGYSVLGNRPAVGGPSPTPATSPNPTVAPSPTIGPSPRISGATVVADSSRLTAGTTYVLKDFEPAFTFTGVDGILFGIDNVSYAWFDHAGSTRAALGVVVVGSVLDETGAARELPADLEAWFRARSDVDITASSSIQLGSASGTLIEGTLRPTAHPNSAGYTNIFCPAQVRCDFESGGSMGSEPGNRFEIVLATVNGKPIVAMGTASADEWPTIGSDFDAFLRSINVPG
jgi:hypothetical protein